jgi:hypothetical protein
VREFKHDNKARVIMTYIVDIGELSVQDTGKNKRKFLKEKYE